MDVSKLSPGKNVPKEIFVVIEISEDSAVKYEVDKESGALFVDRFLFTAMHYPFNYGFIPGTLADDGDPVDVLVMSAKPVMPGSVVSARPIGMLLAEDEMGKDEKIVAVPTRDLDPHYNNIESIHDLPEMLHKKIEHFFAHYKDLEPGKWMKLREWKGAAEAEKYIRKSLK